MDAVVKQAPVTTPPAKRPLRRWPGFPGPRTAEQIGAGWLVFKRGDRTGRIETRGVPFEHPTLESAITEARRLRRLYGGHYDVVGIYASLMGGDDE